MKILKNIFYAFVALLALLIMTILLSALFPNLSADIGDLLFPGNKNESTQSSDNALSMNGLNTNNTDMTNTDTTSVSELSTEGIVITIPKESQYIVPDESQIVTPEKVAGKTGYEPVKEDATEIKASEGKKLAKSLSYGDTGEGLVFDPIMYPYYDMLDSTLQSMYRQIYANALAGTDAFAPVVEISPSQFRTAFMAVIGDHPELFWMDTAYGCKYLSNGNCAAIYLQFNSTASNLEENQQKFESGADTIVQGAQALPTNYDKEVYVHDTLLSKVSYNLNAPMNQSAYSALVGGQTVCAGYARAYQYIMQKLGVPCYYCTGFAGENHAWNIVSLDDGYYNVDPTWDDTDPNTYDYFNKSDSDFATNHMRKDLSVYLPACNGEKYKDLETPDVEAANAVATLSSNTVDPNSAASGAPGTDSVLVDPATLDAQTDSLKTMRDYGFVQADALNNIADYYANCYKNVMQNEFGTYQFQNVVSLENVYYPMYEDYLNGVYREGYADSAMTNLGAAFMIYDIRVEQLQGGYLLLTHNMYVE